MPLTKTTVNMIEATGTPSSSSFLRGDGSWNAPVSKQIQSISASVAANALTITLNPTSLDFRSATLTDGTVNTRTVASAISVTVSSGSTLGTVSAQQSRLIVLAIDNAGTVELAVVNIAGGNNLDETNLISTTAEGGAGAADSASTIYSTTARTNVPYRVVGFVQSTQTTAGTWAAAPSTIQGYGGNALDAMASLGFGQTWQSFTGSRAGGTTYYNTTGKPIFILATGVFSSGTGVVSLAVNGVVAGQSQYVNNGGWPVSANTIVPAGASYVATFTGSTINTWFELR
jgi:hypothetical protein